MEKLILSFCFEDFNYRLDIHIAWNITLLHLQIEQLISPDVLLQFRKTFLYIHISKEHLLKRKSII